MTTLVKSAPEGVLHLLKHHHDVEVGGEVSGSVHFSQGKWHRELRVGDPTLEVAGLVELMDNNPLVCADLASVPDAASTLALIGIGPLAFAGMIVDQPTMLTNAPLDADLTEKFLIREGLQHPLIAHQEEQDLGTVYAATLLIPIKNPDDWSEIDDLFEERYSRSFFVRREDSATWDTALVAGKPFAAYRLSLTTGEDQSLLTVRVMADKEGKCGAAQLVHAMNVMSGYEEMTGTT